MHQILLITAMTATTGLFGGGRHCGTGHCGRPTVGCGAPATIYSSAPTHYAPSYAPCGGYAARTYSYAVPTPQTSPAPAPAPALQTAPAAPAKQAPAPQASFYAPAAPQTAYYPAFYHAAGGSSCPNGNCPRR